MTNGEETEKYLERCQQAAGPLGLARGTWTIGVRVPRAEMETLPTRWWCTAIPILFPRQHVEGLLEEAGFENITPNERRNRGKTYEFLFRATVKEYKHLCEIQAPNGTLGPATMLVMAVAQGAILEAVVVLETAAVVVVVMTEGPPPVPVEEAEACPTTSIPMIPRHGLLESRRLKNFSSG